MQILLLSVHAYNNILYAFCLDIQSYPPGLNAYDMMYAFRSNCKKDLYMHEQNKRLCIEEGIT